MKRRLLLAAVLAVALAACKPAPVIETDPGTIWQPEVLTNDAGDQYQLAGDRTSATVTAPASNAAGNTRIAWTVAWAPATVDHGSCATWSSATVDGNQQGLLLRWNGTTGITVTKGVWASVNTVVNVHVWDLGRGVDDGRFTQVAQFPLTGIGWPSARPAPLPWRMCASAVGDTVRFKVWPTARPEPADGDPCCTGTTTVALTGEGRPGWYAGHLRPGDAVTYTDLTTEDSP